MINKACYIEGFDQDIKVDKTFDHDQWQDFKWWSIMLISIVDRHWIKQYITAIMENRIQSIGSLWRENNKYHTNLLTWP